MKIVQRKLKQNEVSPSRWDYTLRFQSDKLRVKNNDWSDTSFDDIEKARRYHPNETYRVINVKKKDING